MGAPSYLSTCENLNYTCGNVEGIFDREHIIETVVAAT